MFAYVQESLGTRARLSYPQRVESLENVPRIWPVSFVISTADHVRYSRSNRLNQVKEVIPLHKMKEKAKF